MPKEKKPQVAQTCENCAYFRFNKWCYRYPQIAMKSKSDYCGEWAEKR